MRFSRSRRPWPRPVVLAASVIFIASPHSFRSQCTADGWDVVRDLCRRPSDVHAAGRRRVGVRRAAADVSPGRGQNGRRLRRGPRLGRRSARAGRLRR